MALPRLPKLKKSTIQYSQAYGLRPIYARDVNMDTVRQDLLSKPEIAKRRQSLEQFDPEVRAKTLERIAKKAKKGDKDSARLWIAVQDLASEENLKKKGKAPPGTLSGPLKVLQKVNKAGIGAREGVSDVLSKPPSPKKIAEELPEFVDEANRAFFGGLGRAGTRLVDFVVPGDQSKGVEDINKKIFPEPKNPKSAGARVGSIEKGLVDAASLVLPGYAAARAVKGLSAIDKLSKGSKLAQALSKIAVGGTGSLVPSVTDVAQQVGRGNKVNVPKAIGTGTAIDVATAGAGRVLRIGKELTEAARFGQAAKTRALLEELNELTTRVGKLATEDVQLPGETLNLPAPRGGIPEPGTPAGTGVISSPEAVASLNKVNRDLERTEKLIDAVRQGEVPVERVGGADGLRQLVRYRDDLVASGARPPAVSQEIGVSAYRGKKAFDTVEETQGYYGTTRAKGFENSLDKEAPNYGINNKKVTKVGGIWEGKVEPAYKVETIADDVNAEAYAAKHGKKANQDAVLVFRPGAGNDTKHIFTVDDPNAFIKTLDEHGIQAGTVINKNTVEVVDIDGEVTKELANLKKSVKIKSTVTKGEGKLLFNGDYDNAINQAKTPVAGDNIYPKQVSSARANVQAPTATAAKAKPTPTARATTAVPSSKLEAQLNKATTPKAKPKDIEKVLYGRKSFKADTSKKGLLGVSKMRLREKFSPDRLLRKITNPVENAVNKVIAKAGVSKVKPIRGLEGVARGLSKEAGASPALLEARRKLYGRMEYGRILGADTTKLGSHLSEEARARVWATIAPNDAKKMGIDASKIDLSPVEKAYQKQVKTLLNERNEMIWKISNSKDGGKFITREQYEMAKRTGYAPHLLETFEIPEQVKAYESARKGMMGAFRKKQDQISDELMEKTITDPSYLAGKRLAEAHQLQAYHEFGKFLKKEGLISDTAKAGYKQIPDQKFYGAAAGKYVPKGVADDIVGFEYVNGMMQAYSDLTAGYDSWGPRQLKKFLLTVGNPGVRVGNQFSNRAIFSTLNGINPIEFNYMMGKNRIKKAIQDRSPEYLEAVKQGLIGTDITQAEFVKRIAKTTDPNIAKKAGAWFKNSYSLADDRAKLAAFQIHMKQGYSPAEAARLTQRGFQDYKSVGFFYNEMAKTPVIGNAFVRFAGDATRIAKNALVDHPIRTASILGGWAMFTDAASRLSGENKEDKATREGRFGAPTLPFTKGINKLLTGNDRNISLTLKVGGTELNLGRFIPFYQLNEVQSDISRFLPIQTNPLKPGGFQDPILGQVAQVLSDRDFRDRSIKDPDNFQYPGGEGAAWKYTPLDKGKSTKNILRFLTTQNLPLGREADALLAAGNADVAGGVLGSKEGTDIYGKKRGMLQAIGRALGIKVEQFGPEQAKKTRDINKYFDGSVARVSKFLKENPNMVDSYYKFNNPTIDRKTGKKASDLVSPERWKVLSADRSGKLYNFLKSEAKARHRDDKAPIDPVFLLPKDKAKVVIDLRSRPTGDDIEREETLRATRKWYQQFEADEEIFYKENKAFYKKLGLASTQHERAEEWGTVPYPKQSKLVKQYYTIKENDANRAREFYRAHADALSQAFSQYRLARLLSINVKRRIEGYPPISQKAFNNVSFGYEDDERKIQSSLYFKIGPRFAGRR